MIIKIKAIQPFDGIMVAAWVDKLDDEKRAYVESHATTSVKVKVGGKFRIYKCVLAEVQQEHWRSVETINDDGSRSFCSERVGTKTLRVLALKRPFQVLQRTGSWLGCRPSWWPPFSG